MGADLNALRADDTARVDWLIPVVFREDDAEGVGRPRLVALAAARGLGLTGRDALDYAREGSP